MTYARRCTFFSNSALASWASLLEPNSPTRTRKKTPLSGMLLATMNGFSPRAASLATRASASARSWNEEICSVNLPFRATSFLDCLSLSSAGACGGADVGVSAGVGVAAAGAFFWPPSRNRTAPRQRAVPARKP